MIRVPSSLRQGFRLTSFLGFFKLPMPSRSVDLWLGRLRIRFVERQRLTSVHPEIGRISRRPLFATREQLHTVTVLASNRKKVGCVTRTQNDTLWKTSIGC